jgi:hypothetical protein
VTARATADDRGSVTAELAVGLPVVALLVVFLLALASAGVADLRCADAARSGARESALGSDDEAVRAAARRVAGPDATVEVRRDGGWTVVVVARHVPLGPWAAPLATSATASAKVEP